MDITADDRVPPPQSGGWLHRIEWTPRDVGLGVLWFIALFVVAPIPLAAPIALAYGEESDAFYASALIMGMFSQAGIVVVAAFFTFKKYGGSWERLGFRQPNWSTLGWAGAAIAGALALSAAYGLIVQALDIEALKSNCDDQLPVQIINDRRLLALAGITIIAFAPVCEETFFRGFVFPGLAGRWGAAAGVVASGVIFSSAHLSLNLYKTFIPILAIGIVFAYCYLRSGNLLSAILAHLTFNVISFSALAASDCP